MKGSAINYLCILLVSAFTLSTAGVSKAEVPQHQLFNAVLQNHVKQGHVDYAGIQKDSRFTNYLSYLAVTNPENFSNKDQQLAFWINAYNALAIKGIIDGKSPKKLIGRYKFFISTKYDLAGQKVSLDHLEKNIIIPFDEPLIHFAIVCASASCPKLSSTAYNEENLYEMMKANLRDFVNNPAKNQIEATNKTIKVSKIFDWFKDDFAAKAGSVQRYIAPYIADQELAAKLQADHFKVKHLKYDWSLNGTAPTK